MGEFFRNFVKKSKLYGDLAAMEVVDYVILNERYVTKGMVVKDLRGLKNSIRMNKTKGAGKLANVPSEYIEDRVTTLVRERILYTKTLNGAYGDFDILKPDDKAAFFTQYEGSTKGKDYDQYTDCDWIAFLKKPPKRCSKEREMQQMCLMEHPAVICLHPELAIPYIATRSDYWLEYIQTMVSVEKGVVRKYWKTLMEDVAAEKEKMATQQAKEETGTNLTSVAGEEKPVPTDI